MKPKKKDFKKVCQMCMNGSRISSCPSETCLLAPIKDGKAFYGSKKKLKMFCKSCDPAGYNAHAICETRDGCPLSAFYNKIWGRSVIPGLTTIQGTGSKLALGMAV